MPILKPYDPDMFAPGFKNLGTPTKGAVIAGNGSTWQKLTVGANGTVLAANSSETTGLEWVASGGGGGGIYTIVSDEAELIAALSAEDPLIYIDTSITATQDYTVTEDTEVRVGTNVTLGMNSRSFVVDPGFSFKLCGNGITSSTVSNSSNEIIDAGAGNTSEISSIYVSYDSSGSGVMINPFSSVRLINIEIQCPNNSSNLVDVANDLLISNMTMIGGGTSCGNSFLLGNGGSYVIDIDGLYFSGTFAGEFDGLAMQIGANKYSRISNITWNSTSQIPFTILWSVDGVTSAGYGMNLIFSGSNTVSSNVSGEFYKISATSNKFTNGTIDVSTSASYSSCDFSAITFVSSVFTSGVFLTLSSCRFLSTMTMLMGNSAMSACFFSSTATITGNFNAIVGNASDSAFTDSGSSNIFANNVVY